MSAIGQRRTAAAVALVSLAMVGASLVLMFGNLQGAHPDLGPNGVGGLIFGVTCPIVGWFIASRRPENRIGWLFLIVGLSQSAEAISGQYAWYGLMTKPGSLPLADFASWIQTWAWGPGFVGLALLVLLFPDGDLPSPRWRPIVWVAGLSAFLMLVPEAVVAWSYRGVTLLTIDDRFEATHPDVSAAFRLQIVGVVLWLVLALFAVLAVIVRFRRSTGIERQQIKWFAAASLAEIAMLSVTLLDVMPSAFGMIVAAVFAPLVPVVTAIAILRYRLYEIDRLVSRTIAYAVVTGGLVVAYLVVNLSLTTILNSVTNSTSNSIAVAASTLVVAALFTPLRRQVQRFVDRRFDRARYDGERTSVAFAARLRDEVDLGTVATDLGATVRTAIAPRTVEVWLRARHP